MLIRFSPNNVNLSLIAKKKASEVPSILDGILLDFKNLPNIWLTQKRCQVLGFTPLQASSIILPTESRGSFAISHRSPTKRVLGVEFAHNIDCKALTSCG